MSYYLSDVHPDHIDPDTDEPYPDYSDDALDSSFHDSEMDVDDDEFEPCMSCPWPGACMSRQSCEADG